MRKNGPTIKERDRHERLNKIIRMFKLIENVNSSIIQGNQSNEISKMSSDNKTSHKNGNGKPRPKPPTVTVKKKKKMKKR